MNAKQARFVEEYLVDLNGTQAAIRAGYSARTARHIAYELLDRDEVKKAVEKAMAERSERTRITVDRVLEEFARIGFSDLRDVAEWDEDGISFKPSAALSESAARTIKAVKSKRRVFKDKDGNETETVELEVAREDKVQALTQIGRHLGMFNDKSTVTHEFADISDDELDRRIEEAERRKAAATASQSAG